ncbi:hypothetical protein RQM59_12465 [Flavobacteriaceae bacterium S356]|uniref:Uncharacterized protein n=1 Tax=Asprobacillus argus TaxID=3076534 RepID=A0ABU3LJF8_9FLAO|nr:hypothetical protein [Flavobacteriaceae bacterium S356]
MDNELKNSEDFIREKTTREGFSVPEHYFDSVEDIFSAKLKEEALPKQNGFKAPKDYFDTLEDRIIDKVVPSKVTKVIPLRRRFIKMMPVAAAAVIALLVIFNMPADIDDPTPDEIVNWFENDIYRISSDDISIAFEDVELDDDVVDTSIDIDDIETYLENIDTSSLLNEIN